MKNRLNLLFCAAFIFFPIIANAHEHEAKDESVKTAAENVEIVVQQIGEHIYLLRGKGGNVAVSAGNDGVFMIDDDYAEITPTQLKAIKTFTEQPIKYLINTHWHGDHTGGNEIIGQTGTIIMAHDNVRTRLMEDNYVAAFDMKVPAKPPIALPTLTFNDTMTVHMNGDDTRLIHVQNAHTDGDAMIFWPKSNILHTGDVFFNGFYPFIDTATGGSLEGMITASQTALDLCDENTKIIPGHGPLTTKPDLQAYHDMLVGVRDTLKPLINEGKTLEEITALNPLAPFNEAWGGGFLPPEKWLPIAFDALHEK